MNANVSPQQQVEFDWLDCRICETPNAPHYKACKGQRCVSCHKEYQRVYRRRPVSGVKDLTKDKKYAIKKRYGMTPEEFAALGDKQQWCCAICDLKFDMKQRAFKPHVDHCHKTGRVRGLLCNGCNRALGFINDDPAIARGLARYLEETQ